MGKLSAEKNSAGERLCLECGMCCNGVLFADVRLQPGDDPARLTALGLSIAKLRSHRGVPGFTQPCAALEGCRCRIYAERPTYCRQFECVVLKQVKSGRLSISAALKIIGAARERADKVRELLRALGNNKEQLPLNLRFQQTRKRLEAVSLEKSDAGLVGELSLAMHSLNVLLSEEFYPGQ